MSSFFKVQAKKLGNLARANFLHILMTKRSKSSVFVNSRFCIDALAGKKKEKEITKLTRKCLWERARPNSASIHLGRGRQKRASLQSDVTQKHGVRSGGPVKTN